MVSEKVSDYQVVVVCMCPETTSSYSASNRRHFILAVLLYTFGFFHSPRHDCVRQDYDFHSQFATYRYNVTVNQASLTTLTQPRSTHCQCLLLLWPRMTSEYGVARQHGNRNESDIDNAFPSPITFSYLTDIISDRKYSTTIKNQL